MTPPHNRDDDMLARPGLDAEWRELLAQAAGKPWLLKLLAQRGTAIVSRYVLWKQRLTRLRASERRRLRQRLGVGMAGAALALALMAGPAQAAGITVDAGGVCTLAEAITSANNDNAAGNGCVDGSGADTITLQTNVGLTAVLPTITTPITIEGNGNTISRTSGSFRILAVTSGGDLTLNSATISGGTHGFSGGGIYAHAASVTVTNSTLSGNSASAYGGGIHAEYFSSLSVSNSTITGNSAGGGGGGINAWFSSSSVTGSTVSNNSVTINRGGGIYALSGSLAVTDSTFSGNSANTGGGIAIGQSSSAAVTYSTISGNSATNSGGGIFAGFGGSTSVANSTISGNTTAYGGGIDAYNVSMAVTNSNITSNRAAYHGGGIRARSASVAVMNSTLSGNSANYYGGGMYTRNASVAVTNSTISGNSTGFSGGGIDANSSTVAVTNSTISGNSIGFGGGGIDANSGTVAVTNSTISGNSTGFGGGGIQGASAMITVANSTISGNSAGGGGGGIYHGLGTVTVLNSIVALQTAGDDCGGIVTSGGYNIDSDSSCGFTGTGDQQSVSGTDLKLSALAANGGPTETMALASGSVAINQIPTTDATCNPGSSTDQRGSPRAGGTGSNQGGSACDVGAYELQSGTAPNAINLSAFTAASDSGGGLAGLAAGALAALGLAAVFVRRRNAGATGRSPVRQPQSPAGSAPNLAKSTYQPPAIVHRGVLELRAGSPLALPDFMDPDKPFP